MKIPKNTSELIKEAKNIAQKTKKTYNETIAPKIKETINDAVEYANENYPKAKENIKQIYTKVKKETIDSFYNINETFKQFAIKKPKAIKLKENILYLQKEYSKQKVKLAMLKITEPQEKEKIRLANQTLKRLERQLTKAEKDFNEFIQAQNNAQETFEKLNNTNK